MRAAAVLLAVGGCYNPSPPAGVPCGDESVCPAGQKCVAGICGGTISELDASTIDVLLIDAPALCTTWNARHFDACVLPAPMGDLNLGEALSGYSWNTDDGVLKGRMNTTIPVATMIMTQTVGPSLLVASVNNFTLDANAELTVSGARPLLIAVWGTANIAGDIDASADFNIAGPGGSAATSTANGCGSAPTGDAGVAGQPATGAGGGAFQGNGGRGGNTGGLGGTLLTPPTTIQGGCAGGTGGSGTGASGTRGAGGGAIQITARESIEIPTGGSIHVGGGGGSYGRLAYGAGGAGGSGGFLGLDAPIVTVGGILAANGGGGGGGASDVMNGSPGGDATINATPAAAGAGASTSNIGVCASGGSGAAGGNLTGNNGGTSPCGGGGAGGGAGYILVWSPMLNVTGTVSPPAMSGP